MEDTGGGTGILSWTHTTNGRERPPKNQDGWEILYRKEESKPWIDYSSTTLGYRGSIPFQDRKKTESEMVEDAGQYKVQLLGILPGKPGIDDDRIESNIVLLGNTPGGPHVPGWQPATFSGPAASRFIG